MSNKKTNITLDEIEKAGEALALIGYVLTYRLMGIRVQAAELQTALAAAGFEKEMPALPTARKALRRALKAWIHERTQTANSSSTAATEDEETEESQHTLIRVINQPGAEHLVFGIVSEDVDFESLGLSYGTQLRILLHKKTGEILCTTDASGVISAENESKLVAEELIPFWREYRTLYFSEDLSKMLRSIITGMKGVSLRKEGGVYFVPKQEQRQVETARRLLSSLPTAGQEQPFLCAVPVPDVEASKGQMARAIHYGFLDELRLMTTDLEHLVTAEPGSVKTETISKRLLQYKQVKEKVDLYATLLAFQQTDILNGLETLTIKARAVITSEPAQSKSKASGGNAKENKKRIKRTPSAPAANESNEEEAAEVSNQTPTLANASAHTQPSTLAAQGTEEFPRIERAAPGRGENLPLFV